MIIQWYGQTCFRIQAKTLKTEPVIVIDPYDKSTGLRVPSLSADIVLLTDKRSEFSNVSSIKSNTPDQVPFIIVGPGEYEARDVFITGLPSKPDKKDKMIKSIYSIQVEEINLVHLSNLSQENLSEKILEEVEGVDILMIPVGGGNTLDAKQAVELISQIEPRIIIPMYYRLPGLKNNLESVDKFIKEIGLKPDEELEKFKVVKKDLPQEETKLIILKP